MNLTVKRCLLSLVTWATLFGVARAQTDGPIGTVKLGAQPANDGIQPTDVVNEPGNIATQAGTMSAQPTFGSPQPVYGGPQPSYGPPLTDNGSSMFPPIPSTGAGNVTPPNANGSGNYFGMFPVNRVFAPRVNVDSRGGGLYGYNAGYSNIGMFLPYRLEDDAILFVHGQGLITYDGRGGASVGTGWRYWMEDYDRIVGLSGWFDFDNGHAQPYQQLGLSFESLGRYVDYRVNGYVPVSNPDHVISSQLSNNAILQGNGIGLIRNNTVEQSFSGFDAEMGGPTPFLGRYGLNAYIGGYHFIGNGQHGGQFTGVSGRLNAQINEDVQFGVQVTNDAAFGLNTQFQVFMNLPDGRPGRWTRQLRVQDKLVQNVFRTNRVIARTESFTTTETAINPATNKPYFVANINPNLTVNGDGSVEHPFDSIKNYEALTVAQQQKFNLILITPRADGTSTNLDTAATLDVYSGQRLASTSIQQTFFTTNLPGVSLALPGFTGGVAPILFNSSGGDVVTLIGGNTQAEQVSGLELLGSATGNGIRGNNNLGVIINSNTITGGLNGVLLTNLSGTIANGTQAQIFNNTITANVGNGIQITNNGAPPAVLPLDVVVTGNTFSANGTGAGGGNGLEMDALGGATISGIIGGTGALANTFTGNQGNGTTTGNGLYLTANGGTLNFLTATAGTSPFGVFNNTFTANAGDGMLISTTNNSNASFNITNNSFGLTGNGTNGKTLGNTVNGLGLITDSGTTNMLIGGAITTNANGSTNNPGNTFTNNVGNGIDFAATGTSLLSYSILNNTISNTNTATTAPPHDEFTFAFNGTSGTNPFTITNLSDPGVTITSVLWDLTGTQATIASTGLGLASDKLLVLQPINDTYLTSVNNGTTSVNVNSGSNPLTVSAIAPPNNLANNLNTGILANSQKLGMGFTGFTSTATTGANVFNATARFEQSGGSSPLTSAATAGSTVTVDFSNGLVSTEKLALVSPTGIAVSATGSVFGTATPGFGAGNDGIHIAASGSATLNPSIIQSNSITGVGNYGIEIATSGSANASNVVIEKNTIQFDGTGVSGAGTNVFAGGAMNLTQTDSSTFLGLVDNNTMTNNFNAGMVIGASGLAAGQMNITSHDNALNNNFGNGLIASSSGAANLTLNSTADNLNGNGGGSAKNVAVTGGDNIVLSTAGTSTSTINFNNVLANSSNGNGLSANTANGSTLNLTVQSPTTALFAGQTYTGLSSFSSNKLNGMSLTANDDSYMHANIFNTTIANNVDDGVFFNRFGASLIQSSIVNSTLSSNGTNGLQFNAQGGAPNDPSQQFSGTPNQINLVGDALNFNGTTGSVGEGASFNLQGNSVVVLDANATSFSSNDDNGIRVALAPGSQFGYSATQQSVLDNVTINNNASNGIFITSSLPGIPSVVPLSNQIIPPHAPSVTFLTVSANTGNTTISNNGLNGIMLQYLDGNQNVTVTGDLNPSNPGFSTVIQGNKNDGIHSESGIDANVIVTAQNVLVGGPLALNANGGSGIDFESQAVMTILDNSGLTPNNFTYNFTSAGFGTLNVINSTIEGNTLEGINLIGNDLTNVNNAHGSRTANSVSDGIGQLNANISGSTIINNKQDGVNILLSGAMGFRGFENSFVLTNNTISSNGNYGVRFEQNAGIQFRGAGSVNDAFRVVNFADPQPTNPLAPFNPNNLINVIGGNGWNEGNNSPILNSAFLSNWLNLQTANDSILVMTGNTIQYNGTQGVPLTSDGVYIRVSTNSYLSADIRNNTMSGNAGNDFHVESFDAYFVTAGNPAGQVLQPTGSVAGTPPTPDIVVLDDTAQIDMRFTGNVGNTINIVNPFDNFLLPGGQLSGNSTPNGAVYQAEGIKDNFSFKNPTPRLVQLFEVDNGPGLDTTNNFTLNGTTTSVNASFFNASWNLRSGPNFILADPTFPQNYNTSAGDPFLP